MPCLILDLEVFNINNNQLSLRDLIMATPDIGRTGDIDIHQPNYRLPSRSFQRNDRHVDYRDSEKRDKLPYIVLKDVTGRRLDTFTHLQEAIYRARQNIKQTREALTAEEWRLPHAPLPARPDYSRAAPPMAKLRERFRNEFNQLSKSTKSTSTRIVEIDVDDVAFVAQSINHLPSMPSLSFLRQEILAEPKNYFQIVQTMLLHKRFMKHTDKREAVHNFPGFCTGCRRAGLCYGCEQSLIPHYHTDRLMKTGGGFTYYKKYRPEHEIPGRHPLNWKIQFPDQVLKSVMKGHDSGELSLLRDSVEHDENCLLKELIDNQTSFPEINRDGQMTTDNLVNRENEDKNEDEGIVADGKSLEDKLSKRDQKSARMSGTSGQGSDHSGQTGDGYIDEFGNYQNGTNGPYPHRRIVDLRQEEHDEDEQSYDENFIRESMEKASIGTRENGDQFGDQYGDEDPEKFGRQDEEMLTDDENENGQHKSRSRTQSRSTKQSQDQPLSTSSKYRNRDDGSYTTKSSSPYSRKYDRLYQGKAYSLESSGSPGSRRRLYKAPPAFKIRKTDRKKVQASDPFSNDRKYNLDLGRKFELKKSDKKLTEFKEFQKQRGDWKAPDKFELKKNEREDVKFWKPTHKNKENKKKGRSRKTPRPVSPDSGLDSEKMAEMRRHGSGMTYMSLPSQSSSYNGSRNTRPHTRDSGHGQRKSLISAIPHLPPIYQECDSSCDLDLDQTVNLQTDMADTDLDKTEVNLENYISFPKIETKNSYPDTAKHTNRQNTFKVQEREENNDFNDLDHENINVKSPCSSRNSKISDKLISKKYEVQVEQKIPRKFDIGMEQNKEKKLKRQPKRYNLFETDTNGKPNQFHNIKDVGSVDSEKFSDWSEELRNLTDSRMTLAPNINEELRYLTESRMTSTPRINPTPYISIDEIDIDFDSESNHSMKNGIVTSSNHSMENGIVTSSHHSMENGIVISSNHSMENGIVISSDEMEIYHSDIEIADNRKVRKKHVKFQSPVDDVESLDNYDTDASKLMETTGESRKKNDSGFMEEKESNSPTPRERNTLVEPDVMVDKQTRGYVQKETNTDDSDEIDISGSENFETDEDSDIDLKFIKSDKNDYDSGSDHSLVVNSESEMDTTCSVYDQNSCSDEEIEMVAKENEITNSSFNTDAKLKLLDLQNQVQNNVLVQVKQDEPKSHPFGVENDENVQSPKKWKRKKHKNQQRSNHHKVDRRRIISPIEEHDNVGISLDDSYKRVDKTHDDQRKIVLSTDRHEQQIERNEVSISQPHFSDYSSENELIETETKAILSKKYSSESENDATVKKAKLTKKYSSESEIDVTEEKALLTKKYSSESEIDVTEEKAQLTKKYSSESEIDVTEEKAQFTKKYSSESENETTEEKAKLRKRHRRRKRKHGGRSKHKNISPSNINKGRASSFGDKQDNIIISPYQEDGRKENPSFHLGKDKEKMVEVMGHNFEDLEPHSDLSLVSEDEILCRQADGKHKFEVQTRKNPPSNESKHLSEYESSYVTETDVENDDMIYLDLKDTRSGKNINNGAYLEYCATSESDFEFEIDKMELDSKSKRSTTIYQNEIKIELEKTSHIDSENLQRNTKNEVEDVIVTGPVTESYSNRPDRRRKRRQRKHRLPKCVNVVDEINVNEENKILKGDNQIDTAKTQKRTKINKSKGSKAVFSEDSTDDYLDVTLAVEEKKRKHVREKKSQKIEYSGDTDANGKIERDGKTNKQKMKKHQMLIDKEAEKIKEELLDESESHYGVIIQEMDKKGDKPIKRVNRTTIGQKKFQTIQETKEKSEKSSKLKTFEKSNKDLQKSNRLQTVQHSKQNLVKLKNVLQSDQNLNIGDQGRESEEILQEKKYDDRKFKGIEKGATSLDKDKKYAEKEEENINLCHDEEVGEANSLDKDHISKVDDKQLEQNDIVNSTISQNKGQLMNDERKQVKKEKKSRLGSKTVTKNETESDKIGGFTENNDILEKRKSAHVDKDKNMENVNYNKQEGHVKKEAQKKFKKRRESVKEPIRDEHIADDMLGDINMVSNTELRDMNVISDDSDPGEITMINDKTELGDISIITNDPDSGEITKISDKTELGDMNIISNDADSGEITKISGDKETEYVNMFCDKQIEDGFRESVVKEHNRSTSSEKHSENSFQDKNESSLLPQITINTDKDDRKTDFKSNESMPGHEGITKVSFDSLQFPKIQEKRNSFQRQSLKKPITTNGMSEYAKRKQHSMEKSKDTLLFNLPDIKTIDGHVGEQGDLQQNLFKKQDKLNDLDMRKQAGQNLNMGDNSNYYGNNQDGINRPFRRKGLESRPMTNERTLMFQRKSVIPENSMMASKSQVLEPNTDADSPISYETASPTNKWINQVKEANNPSTNQNKIIINPPANQNDDDTTADDLNPQVLSLDYKKQPHSETNKPSQQSQDGTMHENAVRLHENQSHVVQLQSGAISPIIYETSGCPWTYSDDSENDTENNGKDRHGDQPKKSITVQLPDISLLESSEGSVTDEDYFLNSSEESDLEWENTIDETKHFEQAEDNSHSYGEEIDNTKLKRSSEYESLDMPISSETKIALINERKEHLGEERGKEQEQEPGKDLYDKRTRQKRDIVDNIDERGDTSDTKKEKRKHRRKRYVSEELSEMKDENIDNSSGKYVRRRHRRRKHDVADETINVDEDSQKSREREYRSRRYLEDVKNLDAPLEKRVIRENRRRRDGGEVRQNPRKQKDEIIHENANNMEERLERKERKRRQRKEQGDNVENDQRDDEVQDSDMRKERRRPRKEHEDNVGNDQRDDEVQDSDTRKERRRRPRKEQEDNVGNDQQDDEVQESDIRKERRRRQRKEHEDNVRNVRNDQQDDEVQDSDMRKERRRKPRKEQENNVGNDQQDDEVQDSDMRKERRRRPRKEQENNVRNVRNDQRDDEVQNSDMRKERRRRRNIKHNDNDMSVLNDNRRKHRRERRKKEQYGINIAKNSEGEAESLNTALNNYLCSDPENEDDDYEFDGNESDKMENNRTYVEVEIPTLLSNERKDNSVEDEPRNGLTKPSKTFFKSNKNEVESEHANDFYDKSADDMEIEAEKKNTDDFDVQLAEDILYSEAEEDENFQLEDGIIEQKEENKEENGLIYQEQERGRKHKRKYRRRPRKRMDEQNMAENIEEIESTEGIDNIPINNVSEELDINISQNENSESEMLNTKDETSNSNAEKQDSKSQNLNDGQKNFAKKGKVIHKDKKKKGIMKKNRTTKNVKKDKVDSDDEVNFNDLPSIHDTLAKLLPKDKLHLLEKVKAIPNLDRIREESVKPDDDKIIDDKTKITNVEKFMSTASEAPTRPRSTSPECLVIPGFPRLRRTSSLPNIANVEQQNVDLPVMPEIDVAPCQSCGEKNPGPNHVCLPKFKNRFKPKKTRDPNKKVRHGGIGVRRPKVIQTDESDIKSEVTQTTDQMQSQDATDRRSSSQSISDSKTTYDTKLQKEPVKVPEMEERVLTPSSQRISTPTDSPLPLAMSPRLPTPNFTVGKGLLEPIRTPSPVVEKPKRVIQKKQFIKKEIERKPPTPAPRSCTPQTPVPQEKEPETAIVTPEVEEEDTTPIKLPELIRLDTPPLPEIVEKKKEPVVKDDRRTAILPVPKLKEAPKSPTPKKKKVNMPKMKRRSRQAAEAPVTKEEVQKMQDPLDFLAKYCIVSKDRLPFYERIYHNIVEGQPERYERQPILSPRTGMPIDKDDSASHNIGWEEHQLNMFHDLVTISRGRDIAKPGMGVPEQYLEKISYTLEILDKKQKQITEDLHTLQGKKLSQIAEKAKQMIPEIARVEYHPKAGKKSKKKKKKKKDKNSDELDEEPPTIPLKPADITNEVIAMRLDESTYKKICKKGDIPQIDLEMQRCAEKLAGIDDRLMELEGERNLLTLYCMEVFFNEQNDNHRPVEFRRQQSALYKHLHPDPDVEMNIEELEGALQVVNHNLISVSEFEYLYQILNLPGRRKINFQLFTIIAALSEKISQMDPVIKKLLIKDNPEETKKKRRSYEALDLKMETSKELFALLADGDYETNNNGNAKATSLAVELAAGGLDPEHVGYVLSKFNRYGTGYIDFMDFVTYVPLFIEIHQKIVDDPFNVSLDV